jgi:hypothetical protein
MVPKPVFIKYGSKLKIITCTFYSSLHIRHLLLHGCETVSLNKCSQAETFGTAAAEIKIGGNG